MFIVIPPPAAQRDEQRGSVLQALRLHLKIRQLGLKKLALDTGISEKDSEQRSGKAKSGEKAQFTRCK